MPMKQDNSVIEDETAMESKRIWNISDAVINLCNLKFHCGSSKKFPYAISSLYLNLLMYYLDVDYLVKNHGKVDLFSIELFGKAEYGPRLPKQYNNYGYYYLGNRILHPAKHLSNVQYNSDTGQVNGQYYISDSTKFDPVIMKYLKNTLPKFLVISPFRLVDYSHAETQWQQNRMYYTKFGEPVCNHYQSTLSYKYYKYPSRQFWNHRGVNND